MRSLAIALLGLLCACSSNNSSNAQSTSAASSPSATESQASAGTKTVVLRGTNATFRTAEAACSGSLGSVTFSMGHARPHAAPGVNLKESSEAHGIAKVVFSDQAGGKTAAVEVNGHDRSITGKNVTVRTNRTIACVGAE